MSEARARVQGSWFAPRNSQRCAATLELQGDEFRLTVAESAEPARSGVASDLSFSDRIGGAPRRISFDDGAVFETLDNAAVDHWLSSSSHSASRALHVHRLESSWPMIVTSLVITVLITFAAFRWGLPLASEAVSDRLPVAAHESVGRGALATMDRFILSESELEAAKQEEIRARFDEMVAAVPDEGFTLTLHFRQMGSVPNAFALPGGDVVVTDALVRLIEHPEELDSVILHEIGHVHERHGMRHTIQASTITLVLSLALGDVGGLGELATAVPVFLLQSSYSRESESEADEYAFARMLETGRDPRYFAAFMRRLAAWDGAGSGPGENDDAGNDEGGEASREPENDWMSTHPDSERRARRALEVSRKGSLE